MRRMTSLLLAAGMAGVAGCASSQEGTTIVPIRREERVRVTTGDDTEDVRIQRDDFIARTELNAPRNMVWEVVPAVFTELGLPQPILDRANWTARVEGHVVTRMLGKQPLSRLLSCGSGMAGEHADTRRIRLTVRTALESSIPDKTVVLTRVEATAHPMDGTSTAPAECTSRGPLESGIANGLRNRVAGAPDR